MENNFDVYWLLFFKCVGIFRWKDLINYVCYSCLVVCLVGDILFIYVGGISLEKGRIIKSLEFSEEIERWVGYCNWCV